MSTRPEPAFRSAPSRLELLDGIDKPTGLDLASGARCWLVRLPSGELSWRFVANEGGRFVDRGTPAGPIERGDTRHDLRFLGALVLAIVCGLAIEPAAGSMGAVVGYLLGRWLDRRLAWGLFFMPSDDDR